jgi:adenylate cyclase
MAATRRLAAILAADVVGYSRLIGADEPGTLQRLRAIRAEVIDPAVEKHNGRIVKTTGDGLLIEFGSTVDALRCATEVQAGMAERNAATAPDKRIEFRIGIHQGDIVGEDGDIFGDAVNIAARLEALAEPGGICVSGRVQEDAAGKLDLAFRDLGEQRLHNIARPVRAYAIGIAARPRQLRRIRAWWSWPRETPALPTTQLAATAGSAPAAASVQNPPAAEAKSTPRLSIVVLPFQNLSNDPDQEYFADGITDDLTTDLSRISGSFVIARNTAFTYKGKPIDVKQIGRELGVRYVLEGSVRRTGDQVRVNTQLIDAEGGAHLWAERFDTDRATLPEAQSEITSRLARVLNIELVKDASRRIEQEKAVDPDARDLVMRGWAWLYRPDSKENRQEALRAFERALEIDPRSTDARIGIASVLVGQLVNVRSSTSFEQDAARQDVARAERLLLEALESDSNQSMAYSIMGLLRRLQGRLTESRIALEKAITLDPNNVMGNIQLGFTLLFLGRPDEAIAQAEKVLRLSPRGSNIWGAYLLLGWCQLLSNQVDEAIDTLIKGRIANPRDWLFSYGLAGALALKGDLDGAKAALAESLKLQPEVNSLAQWYAYLPWTSKTSAPQFWVLQDKTLDEGLRRIGFPES